MNDQLEIPSPDQLRRFLLGSLSAEDFEKVDAWVQTEPGSAEILDSIEASDRLTESLSKPIVASWNFCAFHEVIDRVQERLGQGSRGIPEEIGDYRILCEIGRGGMGVVYEAEDRKLKRKVALKVLSGRLTNDQEYHDRILLEGQGVASLQSDHIVTIYHVGDFQNQPYLAMEYLQGASLEDWLQARTEPPSLEEVVRIVRELLTGLAAAHKEQLIHRDIKPGNLWIESPRDRLKILDFGIVRDVNGTQSLTENGRVMGSPEYMAPEQARGQIVDYRADLFSAGVVIYEILSGRSPFRRADRNATLRALATVDPEPLKQIPPAFWRFLHRLLSKHPSGRPANALAALQEWEAIEPSLLARQPPRFEPRKKLVMGAGAAASLMLGVILILIARDKDGIVTKLQIFYSWERPARPNETLPYPWPPTTSRSRGVNPPPRTQTLVTVKARTAGFIDDKSDNKTDTYHEVGETGTLVRSSELGNRCYVRWDSDKEPSWVSRDFVDFQ